MFAHTVYSRFGIFQTHKIVRIFEKFSLLFQKLVALSVFHTKKNPISRFAIWKKLLLING